MVLEFKQGDTVEVASKQRGFNGSWYTATIINPVNTNKNTLYLVKYHSFASKQSLTPVRVFVDVKNIRPLPPIEETRHFEVNEEVDAFYKDTLWCGVVVKVLDVGSRYVVGFENMKSEEEFGQSDLRPHLDWIDGKWIRSLHQETSPKNQSGVKPSIPFGSTSVTAEMAILPSPSAHEVKFRKLSQSTPMSLCLNMDNPSFPNKIISSTKRKTKSESHAEISPMKRFRDAAEPENSYNLDKQTSPDECKNAKGDEQNQTVNKDVEHDKDCGREMRGITIPVKREELEAFPTTEGQRPLSVLLQKSDFPPMAGKSKDCSIPVRGEADGVSNKGITHTDAAKAIQIQNVVCSNSLGILRRDEAVKTTSSTPRKGDERAPTQSLPFTKSLHMWESINSMAVFQLLPQQPHFRPLEQYNMELRQGMALGYMMSFADLFERIHEIQLDEPRQTLEDKLTALVELEKHGFTAQPLRSGMGEMLEVKDNYMYLDNELKEVSKQIIQESDSKDRLEAEIDEMKEAINQLNKKLQIVISEKETEGTTVAELEMKLDVIKESIRSAGLDFHRILSSVGRCLL